MNARRVIPTTVSVLVVVTGLVRGEDGVRTADATAQSMPEVRTISDETERQRGIREIRKKAVVLKKGRSSKSLREQAERELRLDRLSGRSRRRVTEILDESSLFRSLPTIAVEVDPLVHRYFTENPEVAVGIWQVLEISKFKMRRVGERSFVAGTGDGTEGTLDVLLQTPQETLVVCDGAYLSTFLPKPVEARAVLHLRNRFDRDPKTGAERAVHQLNMFVEFPSQTVETAARIVAPFSNMVIDRNFQEVSLFLHMMTLAMSKRPDWVDGLSRKLPDVPESRRRSLRTVASVVHRRALAHTAEVLRGQTPPRRTAERPVPSPR